MSVSNISEDEKQFLTTHWIVSATQAKQLIEKGATILDSRPFVIYLLGHIQNAVHVNWKHFSESESPNQGKLLENSTILEEKLRNVGISNSKPVIVVGNPSDRCNFGESGRIVWMLHTLGHYLAAFVDGGYKALVQAGVPTALGTTSQPDPGDFVTKRTDLWEIERDQLKAKLGDPKVRVIDTREAREYAGATPYGEKRGGHLPDAIHFYFKDLLDEKGYLLPSDKIITQLKQLGVERDTSVITYCTGGIRSAFFVAVLTDLGFTDVKNYSGSTWEWAVFSESGYPLTKQQT